VKLDIQAGDLLAVRSAWCFMVLLCPQITTVVTERGTFMVGRG